jgi:hypothetical protein
MKNSSNSTSLVAELGASYLKNETHACIRIKDLLLD